MSLHIKRRVVLDLSRHGYQVSIPFTKADRVAHEVVFTIKDGGDPVELPPGTSAVLSVRNGVNGGAVDFCAIDHNESTVSYIPTETALLVAGNISCDLRLIDVDGAAIGCPSFIFQITDTGADELEDEVLKGLSASDSWGVIIAAVTNAEAAAVSAEAAAASADKAAGAESNAAESAKDAENAAIDAKETVDKAKEEIETEYQQFVAEAFGDIDAALDSILAIQESLIGGGNV